LCVFAGLVTCLGVTTGVVSVGLKAGSMSPGAMMDDVEVFF
jgi:hypothetical protein